MVGMADPVGLSLGEWRLEDGIWAPERIESIDPRLVEGVILVLLSDAGAVKTGMMNELSLATLACFILICGRVPNIQFVQV